MDYNVTCTVCFREYGDNRGRVPRILPCGHMFCERCIHRSIRWNSARCPECETKHPAPHGAEGFQRNYQVLAIIKHQAVQEVSEAYQETDHQYSESNVSDISAEKVTVIRKPRYLEDEKQEVVPVKPQTKKLILPEPTSSLKQEVPKRYSREKVSSSNWSGLEPRRVNPEVSRSREHIYHYEPQKYTNEEHSPEKVSSSYWSGQEPSRVHSEVKISRELIYDHEPERDIYETEPEPKSSSQRVNDVRHPQNLVDHQHGHLHRGLHQHQNLVDESQEQLHRVLQHDTSQRYDFPEQNGILPEAVETSTPKDQNTEVSPKPRKPVQVSGNMVEVKVLSDKGEVLRKLKMFGNEDRDEKENITEHENIKTEHTNDPVLLSNGPNRNPAYGNETGVPLVGDLQEQVDMNRKPIPVIHDKLEPCRQPVIPRMRENTPPMAINTGPIDNDSKLHGGVGRVKGFSDQVMFTSYQEEIENTPKVQKINPPRVLVTKTKYKKIGPPTAKKPENLNKNKEIVVISKPRNIPRQDLKSEIQKQHQNHVMRGKERPVPQKRNIEAKVKEIKPKEQHDKPKEITDIRPPRTLPLVPETKPLPVRKTERPVPEKRKSTEKPVDWSDKVGVIRRPKKQVPRQNEPDKRQELPKSRERLNTHPKSVRYENHKAKPENFVRDEVRMKPAVPRVIPWKGPATRYKCKGRQNSILRNIEKC